MTGEFNDHDRWHRLQIFVGGLGSPPVHVYNTHPPPEAWGGKAAKRTSNALFRDDLDALAADMSARAGPIITAGDFNAQVGGQWPGAAYHFGASNERATLLTNLFAATGVELAAAVFEAGTLPTLAGRWSTIPD